ncbi:DUF1345 domain-containing protein [Subtercola boreus]|uniref:DUF1345 domain-containing protein n=1 Tax=Subtercola boreus TaxID=120213 RepID=A0A3E0WDY4_9MICO|nr:DUF1345 domain-containing protein [Subtercola boreus]RFA22067.1 hypothetical protein B7R24_05100 [Subtercola boreus]RFA22247.1 hypothetical protein B7R23_05045 [Subtercola boreus]RFA28110.1 hypothetical protein B7R25_05170 [Subtercola boreus]
MTTSGASAVPLMHRSAARVAWMLVIGVAAALVSGLLGFWEGAAVVGWVCASATYVVWVWVRTHNTSAEQTAAHATREDPSRGASELLILLSSLASIAAVAIVLLVTQDASGVARFAVGALAVLSLTLSWALVHTLFMLRYASLFYRGNDGGIDFNQKEPPRYSDFAYIAFTIGMTYQVSDTSFQSSDLRSTALRHALVSYVFGAVILAATINLVAGLAG